MPKGIERGRRPPKAIAGSSKAPRTAKDTSTARAALTSTPAKVAYTAIGLGGAAAGALGGIGGRPGPTADLPRFDASQLEAPALAQGVQPGQLSVQQLKADMRVAQGSIAKDPVAARAFQDELDKAGAAVAPATRKAVDDILTSHSAGLLATQDGLDAPVRFAVDLGRDAGDIAEDVLETLGEVAGRAWGVFDNYVLHQPHGNIIRGREPDARELEAVRQGLEKSLAERGLSYDASRPLPFEVITYNTAVGNPRITTAQEDFTRLPFYQKVVDGDADAPILALQEVGPEQYAELERLSANGNFSMVQATPREQQRNLLLVPKRFEVVHADNEVFTWAQLEGAAQVIEEGLNGGDPNYGQAVEPRMYSRVQLRDRLSGEELTLFNTHVSCDTLVRAEQVEVLAGVLRDAAEKGPLVLAGDLNIHSRSQHPLDLEMKQRLEDAGLSWTEPQAVPKGRDVIDYVQVSGLDVVDAHFIHGSHIPGTQSQGEPSDHHPVSYTVQLR